jgi:hypothetical protein
MATCRRINGERIRRQFADSGFSPRPRQDLESRRQPAGNSRRLAKQHLRSFQSTSQWAATLLDGFQTRALHMRCRFRCSNVIQTRSIYAASGMVSHLVPVPASPLPKRTIGRQHNAATLSHPRHAESEGRLHHESESVAAKRNHPLRRRHYAQTRQESWKRSHVGGYPD